MINIIITAIVTLVITFLAGIMVEYFKNLAPKILYNVRDGIPIEVDGKKICAYIITINNPSNKTIRELTLNIQSSEANLKSTGAKITEGLKFDYSLKENLLEVNIPFLSKDDEFSVTVYVENQYVMPKKPNIIIRSPEKFKKIDLAQQKKRSNSSLVIITSSIVASMIVMVTLFSYTPIRISQKDNLMFIATVTGLPQLTLEYAGQTDLNYYDQGNYIYSKAMMSKNVDEIKRYKQFLIALDSYSSMVKTSRCVIIYNIAKIDLLLGDEKEAKTYFMKSIDLNKKYISKMLDYDKDIEKFVSKESLLK